LWKSFSGGPGRAEAGAEIGCQPASRLEDFWAEAGL
jgi:hypothetical protein